MALGRQPLCHETVAEFEGGYSHHPKDPGGVTLEGVIQTVYNDYRKSKGLPLKTLTASMRSDPSWIKERNEIYKTRYWDKVSGDTLAPGVDLAVYDFGVNSGPSRALKYLKASVGGPHADTVKKVCQARLGFVNAIRHKAAFIKGWTRRITTVEARGVAMALAAAGFTPSQQKQALDAEAEQAAQAARKDAGKAGGTVAAPAATQAPESPVDLSSVPTEALWAIGFVILVTAGYFGYRWFINRQRSKAYTAAAVESA